MLRGRVGAAGGARAQRARLCSGAGAQGLLIELKAAADELKGCDKGLLRGKTAVSVTSGCELLVRYVTRTTKLDLAVRRGFGQRLWFGLVWFGLVFV